MRIEQRLVEGLSAIKAVVAANSSSLESELTLTIEESTQTIQEDVKELAGTVKAIGETLEYTEGIAECAQEDGMKLALVVESIRDTLVELRNLEVQHIVTTVSALHERLDSLESEVSAYVGSSSEALEDIKTTVHEILEQTEDF